ncbi:hypothetical protein [Crateriforma conspicua]|uniref:STAS domain-containing protein n=1 Tax=Crateriforma conspicua TaxID=2527996 RepID=A0A5C5XT20_9PLAN|nr:hypothetical protein [Crateriforma conspicua]QDV60983.1 hypothetical protein Mal65_01040 [Crateriforma conspicua]TWT65818.1 hypothetical protein Pan14r_53680 [Crateriforma conspicua]
MVAVKNRNEIAKLPRVVVEFSDRPSALDLERARETIYHRIRDSARGVVVDCTAIGETSVDVVACLNMTRLYAESEGKRFLLYGIQPAFDRLLRQYEDTFSFQVFGQRPRSEAAASKKKRKTTWLSDVARGRLLRIGLPILILFPIVAAVEYFYVIKGDAADAFVVRKSFEIGDAFLVRGVIMEQTDQQTRSVDTATVFVRQTDAQGLSELTWTTQAQADGTFEIALPVRQTLNQMSVDVTIVDGNRAQTTSHQIANGRPIRVSWIIDSTR